MQNTNNVSFLISNKLFRTNTLKLRESWQLPTASKSWISRALSVLAQFCVHQAQPSGPNKWISKTLRVGVHLLSKSVIQKRKFRFYILAFTWIMSGLFRAWNSKYMIETFLNQNWNEESYICGEQLSEEIAGCLFFVFFFWNIHVVLF